MWEILGSAFSNSSMPLLEREVATHSSTLALRIPWTEEAGGLQSMGPQSRTRLSDWHTMSPKGQRPSRPANRVGLLPQVMPTVPQKPARDPATLAPPPSLPSAQDGRQRASAVGGRERGLVWGSRAGCLTRGGTAAPRWPCGWSWGKGRPGCWF